MFRSSVTLSVSRWVGKLTMLGIALVGACLGIASAAHASLPSTKNTLVVPFSSVGGVKLGESFAAARKAWGKPTGTDSDCVNSVCSYYQGRDGEARFYGGSHGIDEVYVEVNVASSHPNFSTPLNKFHTTKGIKLGSTFTSLKHAYPGGTLSFSGDYAITGKHQTYTSFTIVDHRVGSIVVESG